MFDLLTKKYELPIDTLTIFPYWNYFSEFFFNKENVWPINWLCIPPKTHACFIQRLQRNIDFDHTFHNVHPIQATFVNSRQAEINSTNSLTVYPQFNLFVYISNQDFLLPNWSHCMYLIIIIGIIPSRVQGCESVCWAGVWFPANPKDSKKWFSGNTKIPQHPTWIQNYGQKVNTFQTDVCFSRIYLCFEIIHAFSRFTRIAPSYFGSFLFKTLGHTNGLESRSQNIFFQRIWCTVVSDILEIPKFEKVEIWKIISSRMFRYFLVSFDIFWWWITGPDLLNILEVPKIIPSSKKYCNVSGIIN